MKTKSLISMLLVIAMLCGTLAGCNNAEAPSTSDGGGGGGESKTTTALEVKTALTNTKLEGEKDDSKHRINTLFTFTPEPAGHGHPTLEGGPDWSLQPLIYESLCDYSSQPETTFKPQLLESYTLEGKVLTLKLKEGLQYSDGTPINADEIMNNIFMDMSVLQVMVYAESVEKLDDLTVQVTYTKESNLIVTYLLKSLLMYPVSDYGKWGDVYL